MDVFFSVVTVCLSAFTVLILFVRRQNIALDKYLGNRAWAEVNLKMSQQFSSGAGEGRNLMKNEPTQVLLENSHQNWGVGDSGNARFACAAFYSYLYFVYNNTTCICDSV